MLKEKTAVITGVTGQDGRLMTDYLLKKNYHVIGLSRSRKTSQEHPNYTQFLCDYYDSHQISTLLKKYKPNEVYHFAANSFPGEKSSENTLIKDNVESFTNIINACMDHLPDSRLFNASSAYIFKPQETIYTLQSELGPTSAYGISKLKCHQKLHTLRELNNYFAVNGILFNHESIYRDDRFVTVKVIKSVLEIKNKKKETLELGNINITRDWSHAKDFIPAIHKSLQLSTPTDFILSSGVPTTLQMYVNLVFEKVGIKLEWSTKNDQIFARELNTNLIRVISKSEFVRKTDYSYLVGDNTDSIRNLDLNLTYSLDDIISELIKHYSQTA